MKFPRMNWSPVMRWAGRWVLPVFFYGLGLGFMLPMIRDGALVGWMSQEGINTRTASEETGFESTTCQTVVQTDGTIVDTCQDVAWTQDVNIFEVDGFGLSQFLVPVKLIAALVFLAFAYKLTPR